MKKTTFMAMVLLAGALAALGCAHSTCETIEEECGGGDEAIDDCVDDYNDGDADCKKAMRDLADCVEDEGCDTSCASEFLDVANEC